MNKVICDVCGTDYPETEARCPICDCVKSDGGQTSAGNTEEAGGYTYVKGGRFSKSNVRKRLKASQKSPEFVPPAQSAQMPALMPEDAPENDYEDDYDDAEELEEVSNKGLIIIVVLLLLAIIAVASYIVIRFMQPTDEREYSRSTTVPTTETAPIVEDPVVEDKVCTALEVPEVPVVLEALDARADLKTMITAEPEDTTDTFSFLSSDENVVRVDQNGVMTAIGAGEATITVKCGEIEAVIAIKCEFETDDPTDDPIDDPTDNPTDDPVDNPTDDPTDDPTDEPDETVVLKLRYSDVTLDDVFPTLNLYQGDIDPTQIKWTSSRESVATVKNGVVTAASLGSTKITAEYKGQKAVCMVHVSQKALDKLGIGSNPEPDVTPVPPEQDEDTTTATLVLNRSDFTIAVGGKWNLYSGELDVSEIVWTSADESIATVSGGVVTGVSAGKTTVTAKFGDEEVTCIVRVKEA